LGETDGIFFDECDEVNHNERIRNLYAWKVLNFWFGKRDVKEFGKQ